jgi:type 1 glutamine amidotransferase
MKQKWMRMWMRMRILSVPAWLVMTAVMFSVQPAFAAERIAQASQDVPQSGATSIDVLIVGGGSAHDFQRWFHEEDTAILEELNGVEADYTDQIDSIASRLDSLDVLYLSNNQPMEEPALRDGIMNFAGAGKGLLLVHPATWYNWPDWPEYNRGLVGGGSRGHDRFGEFEVTVDQPEHPVMAGVSRKFQITDELYHFQRDDEGKPIDVLATGISPDSGDTYPVVWTTQHDQGRIVCITLGHDGKAHEHPDFRRLLQNAVRWAAGSQ